VARPAMQAYDDVTTETILARWTVLWTIGRRRAGAGQGSKYLLTKSTDVRNTGPESERSPPLLINCTHAN